MAAWSPWEKKDPAMKRTFGAVTTGKGAVYTWEGNKNVGQGSMEIAESSPPSKVAIQLDFVKPFEAHNTVEFTLEPKGDATNLTWAMQGHTPYVAKIIHVFFDMDSMVGKDFEAGLASLKALSERQAGSTPGTTHAAGNPPADRVQHRGAHLGIGAAAARPHVE